MTTTVASPLTPTFKELNRPLQEMVRELALVRRHNLGFKDGDDLSGVLMFAEGGLVCMVFEHFVRMVVYTNHPDAPPNMQLRGLLDYAVARGLFTLPFPSQEDGKQAVCAHRNALLHGNFSQAAVQSGCATIEEYFKTRYAPEMEAMTKVLDFIMVQIDPATGRRRP